MVAPAWPSAALLWCLLGVASLVMLVWSRWPRRVGDALHCRRCDYNLTGSAETCPECGAALTESRAIVLGQKRPRRRLLIAGISLLALWLAGTAAGIYLSRSTIDWYAYSPTWMLLSNLRSTQQNVAIDSLAELLARLKRGALAPHHAQALAEFALAEQAAPKAQFGRTDLACTVLQVMYDGQALTESQRLRYFQQLHRVEFLVRPRVILGEHVPAILRIEPRTSNASQISGTGKVHHVRVEGVPAGDSLYPQGWSAGAGILSGGTLGVSVRLDRPGVQIVECDVELSVVRGAGAGMSIGGAQNFPDKDVLFHEMRTLTATVHVFAEEPAEFIRMIPATEEEAKDFKLAITPTLRYQPATGPHEGAGSIGGQIAVMTGVTQPLAFDVVLVDPDGEQRIGEFVQYPTGPRIAAVTTKSTHGVRWIVKRKPTAPVTLLLRASPSAAKTSVDLYEIWGGELRWENLPIEGGE